MAVAGCHAHICARTVDVRKTGCLWLNSVGSAASQSLLAPPANGKADQAGAQEPQADLTPPNRQVPTGSNSPSYTHQYAAGLLTQRTWNSLGGSAASSAASRSTRDQSCRCGYRGCTRRSTLLMLTAMPDSYVQSAAQHSVGEAAQHSRASAVHATRRRLAGVQRKPHSFRVCTRQRRAQRSPVHSQHGKPPTCVAGGMACWLCAGQRCCACCQLLPLTE